MGQGIYLVAARSGPGSFVYNGETVIKEALLIRTIAMVSGHEAAICRIGCEL